jgi:RNA polymerase subunit B
LRQKSGDSVSKINYLANTQVNTGEKILSFVGSQDRVLADTIVRIWKNKALITWTYLQHDKIEGFNTTTKNEYGYIIAMLVLLNNLKPAQNALLFDFYFLLKNNLHFNLYLYYMKTGNISIFKICAKTPNKKTKVNFPINQNLL